MVGARNGSAVGPATSSKLWRQFLGARSNRPALSCQPLRRENRLNHPKRAGAIIGALGLIPVDIDEVARATGMRCARCTSKFDLAVKLQRNTGNNLCH